MRSFSQFTTLIAREPVRVYLYSVLGVIIALLVGYGALDGQLAPLWLSLATVALGVPSVESARARVTPTTTLNSSTRPADIG